MLGLILRSTASPTVVGEEPTYDAKPPSAQRS